MKLNAHRSMVVLVLTIVSMAVPAPITVMAHTNPGARCNCEYSSRLMYIDTPASVPFLYTGSNATSQA